VKFVHLIEAVVNIDGLGLSQPKTDGRGFFQECILNYHECLWGGGHSLLTSGSLFIITNMEDGVWIFVGLFDSLDVLD
jgi:hypothetical protein